MRKVRIENGIVVEVGDYTPWPEFSPSLVWIKAAKPVDLGWIYDGQNFSKPAAIIDDAKKAKLKANNTAYDAATLGVTADYPALEKDTWPTQDREIRAWLSDPANAKTPWINTAAIVRGIPRQLYLEKTAAKVQMFEQVSAWFTGLRQKYENRILLCETLEEIAAIDLVYGLPPQIPESEETNV